MKVKMKPHHTVLLGLVLWLSASPAAAQLLPAAAQLRPAAAQQQTQPAARPGEPLPKGPLQRLGKVHYRQEVSIDAFAFAPDGKTYATVANTPKDPTVRLWNTVTGNESHRCRADQPIQCVAFAPDGKSIAGACGRDIIVWDTATGKKLRQFQGDPDGIGCLAWSPDGKTLAVGGGWGEWYGRKPIHTVRLLDAATGKLLHKLEVSGALASLVVFSADGKRLASSGQDQWLPGGESSQLIRGVICVWDTETGKKLQHLHDGMNSRRAPFVGCTRVAFSADLARVAFMGCSKQLEVWDTATAQPVCACPVPATDCPAIFTPDRKTLMVAAAAAISLWDAATGKYLRDFVSLSSLGSSFAGLDSTGKYLAIIDRPWLDDPHLRLWDLGSGKELTKVAKGLTDIWLAQATPDGKFVVTAAGDGTVRLWESATGQAVKSLRVPDFSWGMFALAADGKTLAANDKPGNIRIVELPACKYRTVISTNQNLEVFFRPVA
jgi:WD40 repeat protein